MSTEYALLPCFLGSVSVAGRRSHAIWTTLSGQPNKLKHNSISIDQIPSIDCQFLQEHQTSKHICNDGVTIWVMLIV